MKPHKNCRRDQALLFRMRHHLCKQRVALEGTRQLYLQGRLPVHSHRTERMARSKGQEDANGVGGGNEDWDGVGTGT